METACWYDQETGQYYLRARYYNPAAGRFLPEDTYRGDGLNLYAYCANNPVMYYDPSGHGCEGETTQAEQPETPAGQVGSDSNIYYHSCGDDVADIISDTGFRTDIPDEVAAFHNNRYGRGVFLADSPTTALAERPRGTILKVSADPGNNLNLTSRGIIGGDDYTMTHAIARGARKHGYDSITFMSAKNPQGVNTVIMAPTKVKVEEIWR